MRFLFLLLLAASAAVRAQTVAVDVGHSPDNPGATSARGRTEFQFNRELALDIGRALRERGFAVRLIGADGAMAHLSQRTAAAGGADLFLSVHHDSVQPQFLEGWDDDGLARLYSDRFSGFSLFVSRNNPLPARSLGCAAAMGEALRGAGFVPSLYHALPIPGEMKPFADRANGVHYYDNLIVLKTAQSPAVLLEAGVIVHRGEELKMLAENTRRSIAAAVASAVERCLGRAKTRAGGSD